MCKIVQNVQNCMNCSKFCVIYKIVENVQNVQNCAKCAKFCKIMQNVQNCALTSWAVAIDTNLQLIVDICPHRLNDVHANARQK